MIQLWLITFATGLLLGYMIAFIQIVHGQENTTNPNPNLRFVPQPAYIQLGTPQQQLPQSQPQAQPQGNTDSIIALAISIATVIISKLHSDRKAGNQNKESMAEILQNKQVQAELARVMYSLNPEKANIINDAPTVKLETLNDDVKQYADKATKA